MILMNTIPFAAKKSNKMWAMAGFILFIETRSAAGRLRLLCNSRGALPLAFAVAPAIKSF
jgi:hypothetical protein